MKLNDKVYNVLKWICLIVVPAATTLISTLGTIYGADMTTITATIGAASTFVGAVIGISTKTYNSEGKG